MLVELSIRDIVLIESLTVRFAGGLSVLTGETGAGKSILLDALSLALGARGDAGLVRKGAKQGQVTAVFDVPGVHSVHSLLSENAIDVEPGEPLILRRLQTADGRTRGFVNDQPAGMGLLRAIGAELVEIHGQHADRALVDGEAHRTLLDAFGRLDPHLSAVASAHKSLQSATRRLAEHARRVEEAAREADYLRASSAELMQLAPEAGEEDELAERRTRMMKSEQVAGDLNDANEVLSGVKSPVPEIAGLMRALERKAASVPGLLEPVIENLGTALDHLAEAQTLIETAINQSDHDPRDLERTEERLFALRAAARKYKVGVDELPALAVRMADALTELDEGAERLSALERERDEAIAAYDAAAQTLSQARNSAAGELEAAVMAELPALKLERARFIARTDSDPERRTAKGIDEIEFHVQTNPGTNPGPMMKVASGGELSRFLLALKVALADRGSAPTLVFDEIDTGVGGAVADAIGARLARLAGQVQVLSVTHAPQVAALAQTHFLIAKQATGEDAIATSVAQLDTRERREEIARMLSGASVTDAARAAAEQLLKAG